jgi:hypothetical protein
MINSFLSETSQFTLHLDSDVENIIKKAFNKENLDVKEIKTNPNMLPEDWQKLIEILSSQDTHFDFIFKSFFYSTLDKMTNLNFYPLLIKVLMTMLEKGINHDKIELSFKASDNSFSAEKISQYHALCRYELPESPSAILDSTDFIKDSKKKKPISIPDFNKEHKTSKVFSSTQEHRVLIYDKQAEFILRNKILECFLRAINFESDVKPIYKAFNEQYDILVSSLPLFEGVQTFAYTPSELNPIS